MLGQTLVPASVNSIVRTVIVTWKRVQNIAATACEVHWETGPLRAAHVRGPGTRSYVVSYNSAQHSLVLLSAPFLETVVLQSCSFKRRLSRWYENKLVRRLKALGFGLMAVVIIFRTIVCPLLHSN